MTRQDVAQATYKRLLGQRDRLALQLEQALEFQGGVEEARPDGYGSPQATIDWMESARALLDTLD